jgi:hypothetical protein
MTAHQRRNQQRQVQSNKKEDMLDRMFEWTERAFCPASMKNMKPEPKEDVLDFVFTHVESFSCQEQAPPQEPDVLYTTDGRELERDNSLVQTDPSGRPSRLRTTRKIKPLGQEGDLVDYVFEHVESLVCAEDLPEGALQYAPVANTVTPRKKEMDEEYRSAKKRGESVYEQEDEIQLFFRPERRRSRTKYEV